MRKRTKGKSKKESEYIGRIFKGIDLDNFLPAWLVYAGPQEPRAPQVCVRTDTWKFPPKKTETPLFQVLLFLAQVLTKACSYFLWNKDIMLSNSYQYSYDVEI